MHKSIWYISKYVTLPGFATAGTRGYYLMYEMARKGNKCVIITSDSVISSKKWNIKNQYLLDDTIDLSVLRLRTIKYKTAKSLLRVLGWLDFEYKLWRMPKNKLPLPDVIIISSLSLLTILNGILLKKHYKCKLVFEIRDIWPLTLVEEGGYSNLNPLIRILGLIEKYGYLKSDIIVGTMPNLSMHVKNVLKRDKKVYCIPMGIDENVISSEEAVPNVYIEKYIPKNKFIVGYAGTIGITNALDTLFKCVELMSKDDAIHFLIIGDGDLKYMYQKKYDYLSNLSFCPEVPKNMVRSMLSYCSVLYFSVRNSSVWEYGQSLNKVIDYMFAAKPIIASYSGFQSMINEAGCGSFVPAEDEIALVNEINQYKSMPNDRLNEMGRKGYNWLIKNRTYDSLAGKYLEILDD